MAHNHSHSSNGGAHLHAEPGTYHHMPVQDHSTDLGHILPVQTYLTVFGALIVLTALTVGAAMINFGSFNIVVCLLIASAKATLVALFFMHLKYERFTTWIYAAFPLFLLIIMMGGIFIDNPFRANPTPVGGVQQEAIAVPDVHAQHGADAHQH